MIVPAITPEEKYILLEYMCLRLEATKEALVGNMPYSIVAVIKNGMGVGAVLYTNYRTTSIEMAWVGEPGWLTRADLRGMFEYPFTQLGVLRCFGIVRRTNSVSRNFAARIGCREVGILENEYGPGVDGVLYSMTRERCRWINQPKVNGYHHGPLQVRRA